MGACPEKKNMCGCYPIFYQLHALENLRWHPRNHFSGCRLNIISTDDSGSRFYNRGWIIHCVKGVGVDSSTTEALPHSREVMDLPPTISILLTPGATAQC